MVWPEGPAIPYLPRLPSASLLDAAARQRHAQPGAWREAADSASHGRLDASAVTPLPPRHCKRAEAARRGVERGQVAAAVPVASVTVQVDREECACGARGARGCATRDDFRREAVGSQRPRLGEVVNQVAKVPAALAFHLPAAFNVLQYVRLAAVTSWCVYDGLQRGTWRGRWGSLVLNGTPAECGRGAAMPGRRVAVQW